ncbi:unnamed protein product [Mesocestoides corti]|uniref:Abhydrolase_4 domain-containing protein n=1 Tax=Mesocestoides corti TaxID=53468 RepID=A0A0R3ULL2_MESCO|nr:unnamed protein product [Mesocestoides corti]
MRQVDPEVRNFLRELLDFFTHLGNFPPVADPRLVTSVIACNDAYVPREDVVPLGVVFPNSEIRYLPQSGHVSTYVRNALWNQDFRHSGATRVSRIPSQPPPPHSAEPLASVDFVSSHARRWLAHF